jgi:hypothetical protein
MACKKKGEIRSRKTLSLGILKKCSYSPQRSRLQHKNGDKVEQENFKKNCQAK